MHDAYVEIGRRRTFAGAIKWPGWCRSGRDEPSALEALAAYGPRYAAAAGRAAAGFKAPTDVAGLRVVERLKGDATTDFGVPGAAPARDERPLDQTELKRLVALLRASWAKFDRTAKKASGVKLSTGPRGGGRELDAIIRHVLEADRAYLAKLGGVSRKQDASVDMKTEMTRVRKDIVDVLSTRARGAPPPRTPRSGKLWAPRYGIRRSAWHALDHVWEIEDRAVRVDQE